MRGSFWLFAGLVFVFGLFTEAVLGLELVPVTVEEYSVAPLYVTSMHTGAPSDSVMLRVSLCSSSGFRGETNAFVIVEELHWPPPEPRYTESETEGRMVLVIENVESEWLISATRISGHYLNGERRKLPQLEPLPGAIYKQGELGSHWLRPFEFWGWLSPTKFVIENGRARFTIEWHGSRKFELVEVIRIR